jgi:hypothetical protein
MARRKRRSRSRPQERKSSVRSGRLSSPASAPRRPSVPVAHGQRALPPGYEQGRSPRGSSARPRRYGRGDAVETSERHDFAREEESVSSLSRRQVAGPDVRLTDVPTRASPHQPARWDRKSPGEAETRCDEQQESATRRAVYSVPAHEPCLLRRNSFKTGGPGGIRTRDLGIKSPGKRAATNCSLRRRAVNRANRDCNELLENDGYGDKRLRAFLRAPIACDGNIVGTSRPSARSSGSRCGACGRTRLTG